MIEFCCEVFVRDWSVGELVDDFEDWRVVEVDLEVGCEVYCLVGC